MAWLNDVYVFVKDESLQHDIEMSTHPIEDGAEITDHIKKSAVVISLTGCIVYHDNINASDTLAKLKEMQYAGTIINYAGRNSVSGLVIEQFTTSHPNTISGGADFTMTLKEIKIAQPSYQSVGLGSSTDDMQDVASVSASDLYTDAEKKEIRAYSVGGTNQISDSTDGSYHYHTVKSGETIYDIIEAFKDLSPRFVNPTDKAFWIISQTPSAFADVEDPYSLIVGSRILVGFEEESSIVFLSMLQYDLTNKLGNIVRNENEGRGWWKA